MVKYAKEAIPRTKYTAPSIIQDGSNNPIELLCKKDLYYTATITTAELQYKTGSIVQPRKL